MNTHQPASSGRRQYNAVMKWIRRVHMYLGLFMMPFILLYAVTGFLFNHPNWFSDHDIQHLKSSLFESSWLEPLPPAQQVARRVLEGLNRRLEEESEESPETGPRSLKLTDPADARYVGKMAFKSEGDS